MLNASRLKIGSGTIGSLMRSDILRNEPYEKRKDDRTT